MTEIMAGITQLHIPIPNNPLGFTNTYLLYGDDDYLMIDAGFNSDEALEALKQQLSEVHADLKKISKIVITHSHGDHIGLAGKLSELSGASIALHSIEVANRSPSPGNPIAHWTSEWMRESGLPDDAPPGPAFHAGMGRMPTIPEPDILLEDGQEIHFNGMDLRVIWTPGHSPGHICLYEAKRKVLFSADHVLPVTTPNISLRPGTGGNPLDDYLKSLRRVRDLDVDIVLPAHEQIFTNLRSRVDEILEHHHHRNEEIVGTLKTGPKTAYQISEQITWMPETGRTRFHNLNHWDQRMAVSEALAHITALREEGIIDRHISEGVVYYTITGRAG
jgi:glyoxylase-like metal-dependent hydrolase (beta-lactamase superfamily II)